MSKTFPPTALWRHHAQTVRDSIFSYKRDYVTMIKNFLYPEGHPKFLQWFKSYGHFTDRLDLAYWWSCIGKALRLQPAQQACSNTDTTYNTTPTTPLTHLLNIWMKRARS